MPPVQKRLYKSFFVSLESIYGDKTIKTLYSNVLL